MTRTCETTGQPTRHRRRRRIASPAAASGLAAAAVAVAATMTLVPSASASGEGGAVPVAWQACPAYSDDVLRARGITDDKLPDARALLARLECGTVGVPLDYNDPDGRQITVAVTRLKARDADHRLGSIAVNPGGPGGSGYLMPFDLLTDNDAAAELNDRYDLIGFDPRGIGYSSKTGCNLMGGGPATPGPLTEEAARTMYDAGVTRNQACAASDPAFLAQVTTANIARDLDRTRAALGERHIGFLGVSWGTRLGAVYRSMFPDRVGRMFLDSVTHPDASRDIVEDVRAAATEQNFTRFADWIAAHNDTYGFGTTAAQVRTAVADLVRAYDTRPHLYSDLPVAADGAMVARIAAQDSRQWTRAAQALKELHDAPDAATAPPTVKTFFPTTTQQPLPGAPEPFNATMQQAVSCNDDTYRPTFDQAWAAYQKRVADNPATGRANIFSGYCAGWSAPAADVELTRSKAPLVLSGHQYESATPYQWTQMMRSTVGGTVFTVDDDVHGSVMRVPDCAEQVVRYFDTGRIGHGCSGSPTP